MGFYLESSIYLSKYNESENDDFLDKALELSKKSVDLAPYDSQVLNNLGKVYWKKEELEKAEKYLIKASEYGAYILSVHKDLGEFYISNNELEKAEEVLLNSIDYIDYSVKRASKDEKPIKKLEGAIIYNYLSRIYEEWNQTDKASFYKSREEDLIKEAFSIIN
jgi:tetratricopeptide (TPR) repeat protein